MRALLLLAAVAAAGCAPRSQVGYPSFGDPGRFRRFGVLPFADGGGEGPRIAELVARGLAEAGLGGPSPEQMDHVFRELRLDRGGALSLEAVVEVKRRTSAEAVVFGAVSSDRGQVSLIVIDTDMADLVMKARLRPGIGKRFSGPEEIAARSVAALLRRPARGGDAELPAID